MSVDAEWSESLEWCKYCMKEICIKSYSSGKCTNRPLKIKKNKNIESFVRIKNCIICFENTPNLIYCDKCYNPVNGLSFSRLVNSIK